MTIRIFSFFAVIKGYTKWGKQTTTNVLIMVKRAVKRYKTVESFKKEREKRNRIEIWKFYHMSSYLYILYAYCKENIHEKLNQTERLIHGK